MLLRIYDQKKKPIDFYRGSSSIVNSANINLHFFFSHPDYTVGTESSPVWLQKAVHGPYRRSGICVIRSTLPRRIPLFFIVIIFVIVRNVNTGWTFPIHLLNIISMKISNILRTDKNFRFFFYIIGWVCLILALVLGLAWKSGYFRDISPDGCVLHTRPGNYWSRMWWHTRTSCPAARTYCALFLYHPIVVYTAVFFGWFMLSQTIEKYPAGRLAIDALS